VSIAEIVARVAACPAEHRGRAGDPCERFAAAPSFATLAGWPLPAEGDFAAELVVIGQGPLGTASGTRRHAIDPAADGAARAAHARTLGLQRHDGARYFRLHLVPLMRDIFGEREVPWRRVFFTDAVFCPRVAGGGPPLEAVAQCARLHLATILTQPSVRVALCLGDDAVLAATGRYRWEPWRALHGRVLRRAGAPSLVLAVHPMGSREGGGQAWSRAVRAELAELVRGELTAPAPAP
jgi:uracil-DNA glycosylase